MSTVHTMSPVMIGDARLESPSGTTETVPALQVAAARAAHALAVLVDTVDIGFHDIIFESGEAPAIVADKSDPLDAGIANGGLTIEDCVFLARHGCALKARSLDGARMAGCLVEAGPFPAAVPLGAAAGLPAIFLQGEGLVFAGNEVTAPLGPNDLPAQRALGGLQIGGESRHVRIHDNRIVDGAGIGVTPVPMTVGSKVPTWRMSLTCTAPTR